MRRSIILLSFIVLLPGCMPILTWMAYEPPFKVAPLTRVEIDEARLSALYRPICITKMGGGDTFTYRSLGLPDVKDGLFVHFHGGNIDYLTSLYGQQKFCDLAERCLIDATVAYSLRGEYPFAALYHYLTVDVDWDWSKISNLGRTLEFSISTELSDCLQPRLSQDEPVHSEHLRKRFPDGLPLK
ncbi:hypothetical protein ACFSM5_15635 [Lacibacterium aquatile]|uniref:Lipoprotein n=1 Tax=Lacibacterium aquatile TaxID=1168082 RepID=A0ABW5DU13_9PROT